MAHNQSEQEGSVRNLISVDDTVERLAELHKAHYRFATPMQKWANRVTRALGKPSSVLVVVILLLSWMAGNYVAPRFGWPALEAFPFPDLAFCATVSAFVVTLLILSAQRHDDDLAERRARLTLELAILSERKIAKVIALLEEQRRENPMLKARYDPEAEDMAHPVDTQESWRKSGEGLDDDF